MSNPTTLNLKIVLSRIGGCRSLGRLLLLVLMTLWLTACAAQPAVSNISKGSYITGEQVSDTQAGVSPSTFGIITAWDGEPVGVLIRGTIVRGTLYARITDTSGNVVWKSDPLEGNFDLNTTVTTLKADNYTLNAAWDGEVYGIYDLYTVPGEAVVLPQVSPVALISGVGIMLVALGFIIYTGIKKLGWRYMGLGMLAWVITIALKSLWSMPVNTPVYDFLHGALPTPLSDAVFNLYVGLLTGIFAVIPIWLVMRYTRLGKVSFQKALAFGIGFGVIEALLLGFSGLASVLTAMQAPNSMPMSTLDHIAASNNILYALLTVSERFFTILIHIFSNVLIFYAVSPQPGGGRKPGWFWVAFAYKSLIDALAAFVQVSGVPTVGVLYLEEVVIAAYGALGWWGTRRVKQHYPGLEQSPRKEGRHDHKRRHQPPAQNPL